MEEDLSDGLIKDAGRKLEIDPIVEFAQVQVEIEERNRKRIKFGDVIPIGSGDDDWGVALSEYRLGKLSLIKNLLTGEYKEVERYVGDDWQSYEKEKKYLEGKGFTGDLEVEELFEGIPSALQALDLSKLSNQDRKCTEAAFEALRQKYFATEIGRKWGIWKKREEKLKNLEQMIKSIKEREKTD